MFGYGANKNPRNLTAPGVSTTIVYYYRSNNTTMQTAPELTAILLRSLVLLRSMLFTKYIFYFVLQLQM